MPPKIYNAKNAKKAKKAKRPTFFKAQTPRVRPRRPILPPWAGQKRVGGGGPPRGVTIRRPPKVCQRRAERKSNWLCPITAGQSRHSFEQFVRAIRSEVFFPLSFPFPRSLGITGAQLQKIAFCVLLAHLGRFFRLSNCACKMTSKKHRKKCENQGFWPPKTLPKPLQKPPKIDVPKKMRFFIDFCSKNTLLPKCRHRFRIGFYNTEWLSDVFLQVAFCMDLGTKKPSKNLSKTMPGRPKNRCRNRVVFEHRFFGVSASILEPLGPPRWSQVGHFGSQKLRDLPS